MKKKFFIGLLACLLLLPALFSVFRQIGGIPATANTPALQLLHIFENNGCASCHTHDFRPPFYISLPGGSIVKQDMERGLRTFDLAPVLTALRNNQPMSETELVKLEFSALHGTMPPMPYQFLHWTSYLNAQESKIFTTALLEYRQFYNEGTLAIEEFALEPIRPIEDFIPVDSQKVELGNKLFHDVRLSGDNTISCASCHKLDAGGIDGLQFSVGIREQVGDINAPTVFNAVHNAFQFWDGRAKDLVEQAGGPPFNPIEMGSTDWNQIIQKLFTDRTFVKKFTESYPDGLSGDNIMNAIAEFEKTLITPNSKFDKYFKGMATLTTEELEGYKLFKEHKCATCHSGINIGGQSFEYLGIHANYFNDRGEIVKPDSGRYNFTKDPRDIYKQKVPTLRNVAVTAPYFHDGTLKTLNDAVVKMLKYQVGEELPSTDVDKIVHYLHTLTGEYQGRPVQ